MCVYTYIYMVFIRKTIKDGLIKATFKPSWRSRCVSQTGADGCCRVRFSDCSCRHKEEEPLHTQKDANNDFIWTRYTEDRPCSDHGAQDAPGTPPLPICTPTPIAPVTLLLWQWDRLGRPLTTHIIKKRKQSLPQHLSSLTCRFCFTKLESRRDR